MIMPQGGDRRGFAPHPTRGMIPLDPHLRMKLGGKKQVVSR